MPEVRAKVLHMVEDFPGVHAREIERQLGLSSRLAAYHLEALEDEHLVKRIDERGFTRYVPAKLKISPKDLALLLKLRRTPVLQVLLVILARGEATAGHISEVTGYAKPSTSYHLSEMLEAEIVLVRPEGRERWYRVRDEAHVRRVLAGFHPLPGELDAFASIWHDLTR